MDRVAQKLVMTLGLEPGKDPEPVPKMGDRTGQNIKRQEETGRERKEKTGREILNHRLGSVSYWENKIDVRF